MFNGLGCYFSPPIFPYQPLSCRRSVHGSILTGLGGGGELEYLVTTDQSSCDRLKLSPPCDRGGSRKSHLDFERSLTAVTTFEPAGKDSFIYSYLLTRLMAQCNEKSPISLGYVLKPLITAITAISARKKLADRTHVHARERVHATRGEQFSALHSRGVSSESKFEPARSLNCARCPPN